MSTEKISVAENSSRWSEELQETTRSKLHDGEIAAFIFGETECPMKHSSSNKDKKYRYGFILRENVLKQKWIIEKTAGDMRLHYDSLMDLTNDGWALD